MSKNRKTVGSRQYVAGKGLCRPLIFIPIFAFCVFCVSQNIFAEGEYVYDAKGKRNPFTVLVTPDGLLLKLDVEEGAQGVPRVEGIIYDKNGVSYALANGEVVKIGDMVGLFQVLKIEASKVTFVKEGSTFEVEFKEE